MNLEQQLHAALAPCRPGPQLRAAVMARVNAEARKRRHRRTGVFLFGGMFAVAAAAALLASRRERAPAAVVPVSAAAVSSTAVPPASGVAIADATTTPAAAPIESPASTETPGSFTVRVPPFEIEGDDPVDNAIAQRFHESVIARLGRVPGLVLVDPDADVADFDVRIRFTGQSVQYLHAIGEAGAPAALDTMARLASGDSQDRAEASRISTSRISEQLWRQSRWISTPTLRAETERRRALAGPSQLPDVGLDSTTQLTAAVRLDDPDASADASAAQFVNNLRLQLFPVTPSLEQELLGRLSDYRLNSSQRWTALINLLSIGARRGADPAADAAAVRAGAELALTAADTGTRERTWNALRETKHAELVPHLVRGLETELETGIRLQIINILASEFRDDPQAREALEAASLLDQRQVVRMAALRESRDDSRWNEYVTTTLSNTSLSDLQRLQPIADMAEPATGTAETTIVLDDKAIRELGVVIIRAARDPSSSDAADGALKVLGTIESPAVRDVILDVLRPADDEPRTGLPAISIFKLRGTAMSLSTTRYLNDAQIRAAIEEIANGGPDRLPNPMAQIYLRTLERNSMMEQSRQQTQAE